MELYFIRHAIAVNRTDPNVTSDEERWLTDSGIKKMKQAAKGLTRLVPIFDLVYTSPYLRARQTAEIVANAFSPHPKIEETPLLAPGAQFSAIETLTRRVPLDARLAFVGHEPDISELISVLISGTPEPAFEMKKGAISRLDVHNLPQPGFGILVWHLQPKILRMMA